jgi:hypothetical protein
MPNQNLTQSKEVKNINSELTSNKVKYQTIQLTFLDKYTFESLIEESEFIISENLILNSRNTNTNRVYYKAFLTYLFVLFYQIVELLEKKYIFQDYEILGKSENIVTLFKKVRNACCHVNSQHTKLGKGNTASFNIIGPGACLMEGVSNETNDDIMFNFGMNNIYYKRHIIKFLNELKEIIVQLQD